METNRPDSERLPRVAISMGDPSGVGPEVVMAAVNRPEVLRLCRPLIVGSRKVLDKAAAALAGGGNDEGSGDDDSNGHRGASFSLPGGAEVEDLDNVEIDAHEWGRLSAECGKAGAEYLERAVKLAQGGEVAAIVTAPLNKEALKLAGVPYPGHTEMLAALTGTRDYAMMLAGPDLRVIHVSTHISLAEAIERVRRARVSIVIALADEVLRGSGIPRPRIAVAGLNPHAGEGGLFGRQDAEEIRPAVEESQAQGIDASGPHPPDTVFLQARQGRFDIVVAMYHDQGHIPAKLAGFDTSVNITVGLPIVRTSVDHGTAFDIAGRGIASESSMVEAIRQAVALSNRSPTGGRRPADSSAESAN